MSTENKVIVQRMVEIVQNQHQLEHMPDFFEPNFVNHLDHDLASPLNSIEKAQYMFRQMFAAFPDMRVTIQQQVAEGDTVMTHKIFEGTHLGAFMGVAPSRKPIRFGVIDILRLANGKIVEHTAIQDRLGMMQQLGLLPT
ncbi:MAG: ester cyclase [Caldilineaceae bacterium]